ncbi:MAG: 2'-5' RNA ligase family protein [Methanoregula sp.]|nr:2'-5' RNA ligase family protein [Methanoregula sp.]
MDEIFLIEIRLGTTKWRINETISAIAKKFRLETFVEKHPHVTLFGPLSLNEGISPDQLLDTIGQVASRYEPIPFMIDGWERRKGMHGSVIAFLVRPPDALKSLTTAIAEVLTPITCSYNVWDVYPGKKWFHVTIANRLDPDDAEEIFSVIKKSDDMLPYIDRTRPDFFSGSVKLKKKTSMKSRQIIWPVTLDETGLRITVMQGEKILKEYSLLEKCWIPKGYSHTSQSWQNSLSLFRKKTGFELTSMKQTREGDIFLISDLHLGHANIIRYCSRPFLFSDVAEMDRVLIDNWNYVILPESRVFYLGDLRYGKHALGTEKYRKKLNGNITFIRGNHDDAELGAVPLSILDFMGLRFLLVHDPADIPPDFNGWTIHGHHHNNDLRHFPFINFVDRRINVSAEVIGYVPVGLYEICTLIKSHLSGGNPSPIPLRYRLCTRSG